MKRDEGRGTIKERRGTMNVKSFITNNFGLKVTALFLAFLVWAMVTGKERSYSEKTLEVNVEYFNVGKNIDVSSVRPDKVRLEVKGTSKQLANITHDDFEIKFDLKDVTDATRLNFFTEDHLTIPEGIEGFQLIAVHPRMIELTLKKFVTRTVDVKIKYVGNLKKNILLLDRKVVPEKVKITGYKSQISEVKIVEGAEPIVLDDIEESKTVKISLKKRKEILRFEDTDTVDVFLTVENRNKQETVEKKEEEDKKQNEQRVEKNSK